MRAYELEFFVYFLKIIDVDDVIKKIITKAFSNDAAYYFYYNLVFFHFVIK